MNPITCTLIFVFALISLALFLLFKLNPFAMEQNLLKKRRLILTGTRLKITERLSLHFQTLFRQARCTSKKFLIMVLLSAVGGFTTGMLLFNSS